MLVELTHESAVDLLCGIVPSADDCMRLTQKGYMRFSGDQWNENWEWQRKSLERLSSAELFEMYAVLTGKTGE